jgi:hypothetical protein
VEARVPVVAVILAVAAAAKVRVGPAAPAAVLAAAVEEVKAPGAVAGRVVAEEEAAPRVLGAAVEVRVAVVVVAEAKVRAVGRVEVEDRAAGTGGVLVAEAIGSSKRLAGVERRPPALLYTHSRPVPLSPGHDTLAIILPPGLDSSERLGRRAKSTNRSKRSLRARLS